MKSGIEFIDNGSFKVQYNAPSRDFSDLRTEFNIDATNISKEHGPVYIAFSSGVDSQIILRSFIDMNLDFRAVFLYSPGVNDLEYQRVLICKKFYGSKIDIYKINFKEHKEEWLKEAEGKNNNYITQFPFRYLSSKLEEPWPIITQGAVEPALIGSTNTNVCIYHNKTEIMVIRHELMGKFRKVIDFPYSPESVASYYTDEQLQTFANSFQYFYDNGLPVKPSQFFNMYAKPFVKGRHYKKDVIWFNKLTGAENYPKWLLTNDPYDEKKKVSVPYWDLVKFLETKREGYKIYKDWLY